MKNAVTICIISLVSMISNAQDKIGVFAGVSAVSLSDGLLERVGITSSNSFVFHAGVNYETVVTDKISFAPKLVYSQQGDREDDIRGIQYSTSYINAPLNFKFFNQPYILAGPQIGFLIDTDKRDRDYGDLKTLDYGLNLGVGCDIKDFFIELNLYQGFNELIDVQFEQRNPFRDIDLQATNTLIQLSLGYHFDL
ncbi:porin family protein [Nonlabens agnitus]|uniref:Outer membrane protein beta-barrel domain-containing protein n=1 Tax=Nonlabens agnitus TaxID=870484 RepID=A0A2S9WVR4_9FLAO|nr:porin family protein [Nonlabens agnitus]PRP67580.1 hypothetical protein BST86_10995 [Nonlabens agnitus]